MPAPDYTAIRVIADHLYRLTQLTDDIKAILILDTAAAELHQRATQLEEADTRDRFPAPPFNPNPQD